MQVIPVIDVRGGVAVAASRGDRARYRSLETPLAASADPVAVALGLRSLFPFKTLYVADLDGIESRGADLATQARLAEAWSGQEIWIDDGNVVAPSPVRLASDRSPTGRGVGMATTFASPIGGEAGAPAPGEGAPPLIKSQLPYHVLGSESLTSLEDYEQARRTAGPAAPLSLDFRGDVFIGPRALLEDAALWPDRVIVMTLARVGSGEGPDLARLGDIVQRGGKREIYAAGGVRDADDLRALRDIGVAGALIATALHSGNITARDLEALA